MSSKKINPTVIKSKELIIESFLDMLAIKPLSSISICEIAENATVDRRTFYRHFKSKDEIIRYYIHEVSKQLEEKLQHYNPKDIYYNIKALFEVYLVMKETLLILHKQKLLDIFISDFEIIYEKYQQKYAKYLKPEILKQDNFDYYMAYERGAIMQVTKKWIMEGCTYSPDKMGKMLEEYFSIIKSL